MEFCKCQNKVWRKTRLEKRILIHGTCKMPLACEKCNGDIPAINLGTDGPECKSCSPIFSADFFSDSFDVEKNFFEGFIYHAGGIRVRDLLTKAPDFKNADYYFESEDVLIELKTLQTEFANTPEHTKKFEILVAEWLEKGKLNQAQINGTAPPPAEFVQEHMFLLRKSLEQITNKANKQIKQTKERLNLSNAQGLVFYLIDGFYQAPPGLTVTLIGDPLTRQMKSVDGYVVLSLRRKISIPNDQYERFFWEPKYRDSENVKLSEFVNKLGRRWFRYLEELSGVNFVDKIENNNAESHLLDHAIFNTKI